MVFCKTFAETENGTEEPTTGRLDMTLHRFRGISAIGCLRDVCNGDRDVCKTFTGPGYTLLRRKYLQMGGFLLRDA
jgi:hypothetical protein